MSQHIRLVSPCVGICELNDDEPQHCKGCRRTADEIGAWRFADFDTRIEILTRMFERWQAADVPSESDTTAFLIHRELGERFRLAGFLAD